MTNAKNETIGIVTIERCAIELFVNRWPCHGFDDCCDLIVTAYDLSTGDVIDYDACDNEEHYYDTSGWDGAALAALMADAIEHHAVLPSDGLIGTQRVYRASEVSLGH